VELLKSGHSLREVARAIGCDASSVMRWRDAWQKNGEAGLKAAAVSGRPRKLSEVQGRRVIRELLKGALHHGYETDLWTTARVAEVIEKMFGVRYDPDHVGRLLHRWGWSHQKPARRAAERDEEAIEQWKRKRWPQVKKTPGGWVPT
jgi:transposase